MSTLGTSGITEQDIANYLVNTPGFFERHAELLATVQLASPHSHRAVSLQERQMEMLREKIKGLELRLVEMIRNGQENVAIADRLHRWTRVMMLTTDPAELPGLEVSGHRRATGEPVVALNLLAWPREVLPFELATEVLRGGAEQEVGVAHLVDRQMPPLEFAQRLAALPLVGHLVLVREHPGHHNPSPCC